MLLQVGALSGSVVQQQMSVATVAAAANSLGEESRTDPGNLQEHNVRYVSKEGLFTSSASPCLSLRSSVFALFNSTLLLLRTGYRAGLTQTPVSRWVDSDSEIWELLVLCNLFSETGLMSSMDQFNVEVRGRIDFQFYWHHSTFSCSPHCHTHARIS